MITAMNKGMLKRSHFFPTFNKLIDDHYTITKSIMKKKGFNHHSNTRLRDYINFAFTLDSTEKGEMVVKSLLKKPAVIDGRILF
jgi:hypothetical protein